MKRLLIILCLACAVPLAPVGCNAPTTLEAGGAYTDPVLAQTDKAILDSSKIMDAFIDWERSNTVFLAKWPEVGQLAKSIAAQRDRWVRDAYSARDAYGDAAKDYRIAVAQGIVTKLPPNRAKVDAAIAVLTNVTSQIIAYQNAHRT